jgi:hypothetical protein
VAVALLSLGIGCGEGEPDSDAAAPAIYVTPSLCAEARTAYRANPRPGGELVSLVCLDRVGHGLAAIGAGARRASENSATIAYIGEPDRKSVDFSEPILEAAGIGATSGSDGAAAMTTVLRAVGASAGDDDLRAAVREQLEGG